MEDLCKHTHTHTHTWIYYLLHFNAQPHTDRQKETDKISIFLDFIVKRTLEKEENTVFWYTEQ